MSSNNQDIDILRELERVNQDIQGKIQSDPKIIQTVTKPKTGFTDFRKLCVIYGNSKLPFYSIKRERSTSPILKYDILDVIFRLIKKN